MPSNSLFRAFFEWPSAESVAGLTAGADFVRLFRHLHVKRAERRQLDAMCGTVILSLPLRLANTAATRQAASPAGEW
jgi:hypothetical protein